MNTSNGLQPPTSPSSDGTSRLCLQGFAFKLLIIVAVSIPFAARHQSPVLEALAYFCFWFSLCSSLAVIVRKEKINAPSLNAWDEAVAFFGLALAMRLADAIL